MLIITEGVWFTADPVTDVCIEPEVGSYIAVDGFESSDTSAWSAGVPLDRQSGNRLSFCGSKTSQSLES